jgi:hypothetical protein
MSYPFFYGIDWKQTRHEIGTAARSRDESLTIEVVAEKGLFDEALGK